MYAPYSVGLPGFPAYAGALGPLPAGLAPLAGQLPAGYPLAATGYPPSAAATSAASLMSNGHGISIPTQVTKTIRLSDLFLYLKKNYFDILMITWLCWVGFERGLA